MPFLSDISTMAKMTTFHCGSPVVLAASDAEGGGHKTTCNFLSHKMTQNNTLNQVHVAETELSQPLSQNTNMFGEATVQSRDQTLCSSRVN